LAGAAKCNVHMRDGSGITAQSQLLECVWKSRCGLPLAMLLEPENRFEPALRSSTRSAILRVMLSRCNNRSAVSSLVVSTIYCFLSRRCRGAASLTQQDSETCHQACSRKSRFAAPEKKNQETIIALVCHRESSTGIKERNGNWGTTRFLRCG
jgi:hypothetical protein